MALNGLKKAPGHDYFIKKGKWLGMLANAECSVCVGSERGSFAILPNC